MQTTKLGRTDLIVTRTAFGALPIQRTDMEQGARIFRAAFDGGITFFDTARAYTDSEAKMGMGLSDVRDSIVIATKTTARTRSGVLEDIETSLRELRTDRVDLLQLHNPKVLPDPNDPESSYSGLVEAREKGLTRFIGVTSHSRERAVAAVGSGLYDTLQYPMCHISAPEDVAVIDLCRQANVGFIAMKPLAGGLLTQLRPAFAFFEQYDTAVPIWGVQRMSELDELLAFAADPPALDDQTRAVIERDRVDLADDFCRACGYCLPCPQGINIPMAARMNVLLYRMPYEQFLTERWRDQMRLIETCANCGQCRERCPYDLDPPALLRKSLEFYEGFYDQHADAPR